MEKKIDTEWKAKVQQEKERLSSGSSPQEQLPPPPTFLSLISDLALQASIFLGTLPHPVTGKREIQLEQARYTIDLLTILEEKTKGNLSPHEAQTLASLLYELRMTYVQQVSPSQTHQPSPSSNEKESKV